MSEELGKVRGVNVNHQYHESELDSFSRLFFRTISEPIKHTYYELVDKDGKIVQIVCTNERSVVISAANRMGLDYRLVEFDETFENLETKEERTDG